MDLLLRVLLVEDNPGDARLIQEHLRDEDRSWAELEWARTLAEAMDLVSSGAPDVILLDLGLPDADGLSGFRQLQEEAPGVPVVILTGLADEELAAGAVSAGAQDYLVKGEVDAPVLRRSIRYAVERARVSAALLASTEQLRIRGRVSELFLSHDDDEAFGGILDLVLEKTCGGHGVLGTLNREGDLRVRAVSRMAKGECRMEDGRVLLPKARWKDSLLGRAMETGKAQQRDEGPFHLPRGHVELRRVVAMPILDRDEPVGLLAVANAPQPFGSVDLEFLESLAAHMAPILRARLARDAQAAQRQAAEARLRELNQELEARVTARTSELRAANRELEAFAYSVSHDLRAPLRAIDGFARILEDEYGEALDSEGLRLLGVVRKNAGQMGVLIDDLLEFSRVGRKSMNPRWVDMEELVGAVVEELPVETRDDGGPVRIGSLPRGWGDPALLRQVWANLLFNAVKFSRGEAVPVVEVNGWQEEGRVVYRVADNGVGFDMAFAGKLFGVFERLHPEEEFEGTGVGLALAGRIVGRHGGRIWGEGAVGRGATFCFSLPQTMAKGEG